MNQQTKLIILLTLAGIFFIILSINKPRKNSLQQKNIEVSTALLQSYYELANKVIKNYEILNVDIVVNKDPFLIKQPKQEEGKIFLPKINVQGVLSGEKPKVIIDGEILEEGDIIRGIRILKIRNNRLELLYKGENFVLRVD